MSKPKKKRMWYENVAKNYGCVSLISLYIKDGKYYGHNYFARLKENSK